MEEAPLGNSLEQDGGREAKQHTPRNDLASPPALKKTPKSFSNKITKSSPTSKRTGLPLKGMAARLSGATVWGENSRISKNTLKRNGTPSKAAQTGDLTLRNTCKKSECNIHVSGWSAELSLALCGSIIYDRRIELLEAEKAKGTDSERECLDKILVGLRKLGQVRGIEYERLFKVHVKEKVERLSR